MSSQNKKVALLQMLSGASVADNMTQLEQLLKDAAEQGALLAVVPENFALFQTDQQRSLAEQGSKQVIEQLRQLAIKYNIWLIAGSLPLASTEDNKPVLNNRVRAACLVIDDQGEIQARYDKIHLFDVEVDDPQGCYKESAVIEPGDKLVLVDSPVGCIGLSICYDLRFPEHYQRLRARGAELIVVPSAFTQVTGHAHWQPLLQARAIETQCYILGVNQGGQHSPNRFTWGHSMLVDAWGQVQVECEYEPQMLLAEINLAELNNIRSRMPVLQHKQQAGF